MNMTNEMKKVYVKPEAEILEIELQAIISTSVSAGGEGIENGDKSEGGMEADGNRYRGEWGNLWAN